jgi:hypothetical protein
MTTRTSKKTRSTTTTTKTTISTTKKQLLRRAAEWRLVARTIHCTTRALYLRRRRSRAWKIFAAFALGTLFAWVADRGAFGALPVIGGSSFAAGAAIALFIRAGARADRTARRLRAQRRVLHPSQSSAPR